MSELAPQPELDGSAFADSAARLRERMKDAADGGFDIEANHSNADDAMTDFLREIGLGDVADMFEGMAKWYA